MSVIEIGEDRGRVLQGGENVFLYDRLRDGDVDVGVGVREASLRTLGRGRSGQDSLLNNVEGPFS